MVCIAIHNAAARPFSVCLSLLALLCSIWEIGGTGLEDFLFVRFASNCEREIDKETVLLHMNDLCNVLVELLRKNDIFKRQHDFVFISADPRPSLQRSRDAMFSIQAPNEHWLGRTPLASNSQS